MWIVDLNETVAPYDPNDTLNH